MEPFKALILVAEDDQDTRDLVSAALGLKHYVTIEASDGQALIAQVQKELPHLIIADIMMPRLDGFEAVTYIRKDPRCQNIPVIFMSGVVSGEDIIGKIKSMPRCAFIPKPFDHTTLLAAIEKLLHQTPPA
jgi:CheY-like chemotaxis protein